MIRQLKKLQTEPEENSACVMFAIPVQTIYYLSVLIDPLADKTKISLAGVYTRCKHPMFTRGHCTCFSYLFVDTFCQCHISEKHMARLIFYYKELLLKIVRTDFDFFYKARNLVNIGCQSYSLIKVVSDHFWSCMRSFVDVVSSEWHISKMPCQRDLPGTSGFLHSLVYRSVVREMKLHPAPTICHWISEDNTLAHIIIVKKINK